MWLGGVRHVPEISHQALALPGTPASLDLGNCVCEHILYPPLSWAGVLPPEVPSVLSLPWVLGGQSRRRPPRSSSPAVNLSLAQAPGCRVGRVLDIPEEFVEKDVSAGTERAQPERMPQAESALAR